jgi:selenide,water dikinase
MSACAEGEFITPVGALPGDILVLTKPLGTQVAVNLNEWRQLEDKSTWQKALEVITEEEVHQGYALAVESMCRLNRTAARLMHK